jgi:hypothetical protein
MQIKSRRMVWAVHVACMGEDRKCTGFWWESPKGKRPLGRPRHRLEDGIRMELRKIGCGGVEWI